MEREQESFWKYLPYVTVRDAWHELWGLFLVWIFVTVLAMAFVGTTEIGLKATEAWWSEIPTPIFFFLAFAAFTWFTRGQSFALTVPKTVKGWVGVNAAVLLGGFLVTALPAIALAPAYTFLMFAPGTWDSLNNIGRRNKERLDQSADGSA